MIKINVTIIVLLILISNCAVCAADTSGQTMSSTDITHTFGNGIVSDDHMFLFNFTKVNDTHYKVKLTRKNSLLKKYNVQFIYVVLAKTSDHRYVYLTKYMELNEGQNSIEYTEAIDTPVLKNLKVVKMEEKGYGVKFPAFSSPDGNAGIRDSVFRLLIDRNWGDDLNPFTVTGAHYYIYLSPDVKTAFDFNVTIHRCVHGIFSDWGNAPVSAWGEFKLPKNSTQTKNYIRWKELDDLDQIVALDPDEYYIKFQ